MRAYYFTSETFAVQAIEKQRLKVATINDLNDPFELLACDLTSRRDRRGFLEWKRRTAAAIGFLCFSKTWRSPLLWSHYANRHRGVALEIEVDDQVAVPVRYSKSRLRLNTEWIMKNGGFSGELAERLVASKSIDWCYEKEVRVPIRLSECILEKGLYFEKLSDQVKVTGAIVGPLSTITEMDLLRVLPRGQQFRMFWARLAFGQYNIVYNRAKPRKVLCGES